MAKFIVEALSEALQRPYQQGDLQVTVGYLAGGLSIGPHRVLLKRNFDTACWIPPVGSRESHSIYYGDRMVARVVEHFMEVRKIEIPEAELVLVELDKAPEGLHPKTQKLDAQLRWFKETPHWDALVDWLVLAVAAYGRHEREHARQTIRDLKRVSKDLRLLKLPFQLFNLFEDARIEHHSRKEMGTAFGWTTFEALCPTDTPTALFLRCVQLEGAPDKDALESEEPYKPRPEVSIGSVAERVAHYYERACECTTSEQLYPVIAEFLLEFRADLKNPEKPESGDAGKGEGSDDEGGEAGDESGGGEGGDDSDSGSGSGESKGKGRGKPGDAEERAGDLSTAAEAAEEGDSFFEEFEEGAVIVGGNDAAAAEAEAEAKAKAKAKSGDGNGSSKGKGGQDIPESVAPQASGGQAAERYFLADEAGKLDEAYAKRLEKLTSILMRMFKTHSLPMATENPGQRVSGRHLARGELRYVQKRVFGGKGKRKYFIVYDCSGSMSGQPDREGKLFLLALNNIAKRGFLEGRLVLSGYVGRRPGWLSYSFPVKDDIILRIQTSHPSEGIQDALKDNLAHIKGMDDVFVYTDACITDAPLNKEFFARNKVWPVGLYVGDKDSTSEMERHFPQNVIKDRIEDLAETLLTRNRRTTG